MRGVLIFAVLLGAVAGYRPPSYAAALQSFISPKDGVGSTEEPAKEVSAATITASTATAESLKPSTTLPPSSTTAITLKPTSATSLPNEETPLEEPAAEFPVSLGPPLLPEEEHEPSNQRRVVTYDQRQEGQYNIRADLENFMIVLIPPSPAEGLNLLDLLSKSSLRRSSHGSKSKRKHYGSAMAAQAAPAKYRQSLKSGGSGNQNFNYLSRQSLIERGGQNFAGQPIAIVEGGGGSVGVSSSSLQRLPEFIEGRTPYHVDISSSNANNNDDEGPPARQIPDRQVDVLPPPYPPIGYQHHLIKPFHLDAEPTVIQALPPPELGYQSQASGVSSSGNFLETYNQLLAASGLQSARNDLNSNSDSGGGYYRVSRAIRGDNFLDSNRLTSSGGGDISYPLTRASVPFYRSDLSFGASSLYPPLDVPRLPTYLTSNARNFELSSDADQRDQRVEDAHMGEIIVHPPPSSLEDDLIDLDLHGEGISFIDAEAKALLSDGLERCAPGRRRDSYGVCREIEGY